MSANDSASGASSPSSMRKSSEEQATSKQQYKGQTKHETRDAVGGAGNPEIEFSANVKARELRFEEEPQTKVRFWGHPERNSVSLNERKNLPEKVQQDVTYRDVSVRSHIASELVAAEEEPDITRAARQKAEELGVDLSQIEGTGSGGLITIRDVVRSTS